MAQKVPARPEGQPQVKTVVVQSDLASRTLDKLQDLLDQHEMGQALHPDKEAAALALLREAFKEAHCDHTLHQAYFWDLGAQSRVRAQSAHGEVSIPSSELPPVGTVLDWAGDTYYIASHRP